MSKKKKLKACCKRMAYDLNQVCDRHPDRFDCADAIMHRSQDGDYGIIVHDGGTSYIKISYCPWCGTKFPKAKKRKFMILPDVAEADE